MGKDDIIQSINKTIYRLKSIKNDEPLAIAVNQEGWDGLMSTQKDTTGYENQMRLFGYKVYKIHNLRHKFIVGRESRIKQMNELLSKVTISFDIKKDGFHD
jgi:hypothetical protein